MKKDILLASITVIIWGTLSTVTKFLVTDLPNMEVLAISSTIATGFMLLISIWARQTRHFKDYTPKKYGKMIFLGFMGIFLHAALYYYGLSQLSSQVACIVNYLWPMIIVVLSAPILKEKLTGKKIFAIVCSFAGVVVLVSGSGFGGNKNALIGIAVCFAGAVCYGLYSVLDKKEHFNQDIFMTVSWGVSAVSSTVIGLATEKWVMPSAKQWLLMLYLGMIVYAVAYLTWGIALIDAKNTALISNLAYLVPVLSMGVAAIVLKEKLEITALIALALVVGGILFQSTNFKKANKRSTDQ